MGFVLSHEQFPTAQLVDQAQAAEQAGFRYLWATSDHIQPWQENEGHSMFPWITLALVCPTNQACPVRYGRDLPYLSLSPDRRSPTRSPRLRSSILGGFSWVWEPVLPRHPLAPAR